MGTITFPQNLTSHIKASSKGLVGRQRACVRVSRASVPLVRLFISCWMSMLTVVWGGDDDAQRAGTRGGKRRVVVVDEEVSLQNKSHHGREQRGFPPVLQRRQTSAIFSASSSTALLLLLVLVTLSTCPRLSEAGFLDNCQCPTGVAVCSLSNLEPADCRSDWWDASTGTLDASLNLVPSSETVDWSADLTGLKKVSFQFYQGSASATRLTSLLAPDLVTIGTTNNVFKSGPNPKLEVLDLSSWDVEIGTDWDVRDNPKLRSLKLGKVTGTSSTAYFKVRQNKELTELDLSSFATSGEDVEIIGNPKLASFELPALTSIATKVDITGNAVLTTVKFPKLSRLPANANIVVQGNHPSLTSVELLAMSGADSVPSSSSIQIIGTTASSCRLFVACSVQSQAGKGTLSATVIEAP